MARFVPYPKLKFMEQCREVMRFRGLALRSEQAYLDWIRRFILFQGRRHPQDMGEPEVRAFLTGLAARQKVAAATQNQAFNALRFLYRHVLGRDLGMLDGVERAKRSQRVPVVLTKGEVQRVLTAAAGYQLPLRLLYGTGHRRVNSHRAAADLALRCKPRGIRRIRPVPGEF